MTRAQYNALYYITRLFVYLLPYTFIAAIITQIPFGTQLKAEFLIVLAGFTVFFLDMHLQNFLEQPLSGKLIYLVIISVLTAISFYLLSDTYTLVTFEKTTNWIIFQIIHIYILLYWCYLNFKKAFIELWDLDLA